MADGVTHHPEARLQLAVVDPVTFPDFWAAWVLGTNLREPVLHTRDADGAWRPVWFERSDLEALRAEIDRVLVVDAEDGR